MGIFNSIKNITKKNKQKIDEFVDEQKMMQEVLKEYSEYEISKNEKEKWNTKFDKEEDIYLGDREFGNIYSETARNDARTPMRISHMLIEAQIDLSVPTPVFKPVAQEDEAAIRKLQAIAAYVMRYNDLDEINTIAERDCKKHGTTIYKIIWNNDYTGNGFRGWPEIITVHPKNIIPGAGTISKSKLEIVYHVENETLSSCIRRYGDIAKKLPKLGELASQDYDEVGNDDETNVNKTNDIHNSPDNMSNNSDNPLNKYLIIEKWYIDEKGDIGLKVFSGKLMLLKKPKFYYRRKYNPETEQYEVDEKGNEALVEEQVLAEEHINGDFIIPKGTKVKPYIPKTLPIVFQNNIPRSKCVWGESDIDILKDLEESAKKVYHKYEERMLNGVTKFAYQKDNEQEAIDIFNNEDMQFIPMNDPIGGIRQLDLKTNDSDMATFFELINRKAEESVGVAQTFRGINQGEATSGKMAQALIQQTAEKINIKVNEKNIAYKKIYRLICDFILAFSNDRIPYRVENTMKPEYGKFNKYDMLHKDDNDNWIYPDFDIDISAENGFPKTQTFMFDSITQLASQGFFDPTPRNILIWQLLEKIGFPNATSILQNIKEQLEQMQPPAQEVMTGQEQPDMNTIISQLPPDIQQQFSQLSPEEQTVAMQGR